MVHFSCLEAKYGTPGPGVIKQVLEKEKDTEWNKMCIQRSLSETFPIWVSHLLPPTPKSLCPSSRFESLKPQLGIVKSTLTWRWELDRTPLGRPKNCFHWNTCQQHMSELWKWIPKKSSLEPKFRKFSSWYHVKRVESPKVNLFDMRPERLSSSFRATNSSSMPCSTFAELQVKRWHSLAIGT